MTSARPAYSQEDIQQILNLAIARQAGEELPEHMLSREQLLEIAEEMGIPLATLNAAEKDWQEQKGMLLRRRDFDLYRRNRFSRVLFRYALLTGCVGLFGLIPGVGWSLPWLIIYGSFIVVRGFFLTMQYWDVYFVRDETYEKEFQNWYRRYQMRYAVNHWVGKVSKFLGASPNHS